MGILGKEAGINVVNVAIARNRACWREWKKSSRGRVVEIAALVRLLEREKLNRRIPAQNTTPSRC
jgi:hypothetical protein